MFANNRTSYVMGGVAVRQTEYYLVHNVIEVAHRYAVQGSDTTMLTIAASLHGQYIL